MTLVGQGVSPLHLTLQLQQHELPGDSGRKHNVSAVPLPRLQGEEAEKCALSCAAAAAKGSSCSTVKFHLCSVTRSGLQPVGVIHMRSSLH